MKSAHFAISSGSRMPEAEYLPRLVLHVHRSKKGGGLFKKSAEIVRGIAELAIPVLVSFYARRGRGIVILHQTLAQKKVLSFPQIVVHDLESLEKTFTRSETDYNEFIRGLSTLVASIAGVKQHTRAFESLPGKEALDDLRELLGSVFETESTDVFLFDSDSFEQNKEVEEIHQMLECEEDKLSSLPSHLDDIQELITLRSQSLIANLSEECEKTMVMRNKKRRETIDAFKIKASEIKQLKRDNDEDEENLLSDRMGRRKTVEYRLQQVNKQLSSTSGEVERLKDSIAEYKNQLVDIDRAIREIKERAANRRTELHNQLLALDEQLENFDNETESVRYEYKEKMQTVERLLERFMAAKEAYIINAKNALTDRINELSINLPLPGVAEDAHGSFVVYIPAFLALFKDDKAGTQRLMVFPPKSVTDDSKSLASSLLAKFSGADHREGLDDLLTENLTNRLMSDRELELALLEHMSRNSVLERRRSVIANGAETLRRRERISEDEIPPQFELIGDMPDMVCQLAPGEEKEYQYRIRANTGGHFSTRAVCDIENKFSLDDLLSNEMEVYVSPLSIQMKAQEMMQERWKPLGCILKNISKEHIASITVSLKENSKFDLDKILVCTEFLGPNQSVVIQPVLRTRESGSVSLNLDVNCIDENGVKYHAEKDFSVQVMEADKTVTKIDIGSIGEVVSSGATQIKDSVIQRSTVGAAETSGTGDSSTKGSSIEVSDSIVQHSQIAGADAIAVERRCAKCNNRLQEGWRMCPFCGTELELKCPQCSQKVEAGWIACPFCGGKLK